MLLFLKKQNQHFIKPLFKCKHAKMIGLCICLSFYWLDFTVGKQNLTYSDKQQLQLMFFSYSTNNMEILAMTAI